MAKRLQVRDESEVSALVEEKCHRAASGRAPLGGFGVTSRPVTISLA
jgi:hypothetical protein